MPSFLSGVRGGIEGKHTKNSGLSFLHRTLSGQESTDAIETEIRKDITNQGITFVVNNACNLTCKHCYLQVDSLTSPALSIEESKRFLASALDSNPHLICLAGKEVFLGRRGIDLLNWLTASRQRPSQTTRIGVITNGTLLHLHRDAVLSCDIDYMDISVDGVREDHDFNRSEGAYDRMMPNLVWAAAHFKKRLFASITLHQRNFRRLPQAVSEIYEAGVSTIGCSFYHRLTYTPPEFELQAADYADIFKNLSALGVRRHRRPLTVLVEVDVLSLPAMLAFFRSDWFVPNNICVDNHGEFYCEHILRNGVRLQIRFSPFPFLACKSLRITPEGNCLAAEDTANAKFYARRSLGNIRDFDFDCARLLAHAANAPRLQEITNAFFADTFPQIQEAYSASKR